VLVSPGAKGSLKRFGPFHLGCAGLVLAIGALAYVVVPREVMDRHEDPVMIGAFVIWIVAVLGFERVLRTHARLAVEIEPGVLRLTRMLFVPYSTVSLRTEGLRQWYTEIHRDHSKHAGRVHAGMGRQTPEHYCPMATAGDGRHRVVVPWIFDEEQALYVEWLIEDRLATADRPAAGTAGV
jgi:hypothetical protein